MLVINIPKTELYDRHQKVFINVKPTTVSMIHSLISISKWEQKFEKSFLSSSDSDSSLLSSSEWKEYIRCMSLKPISDEAVEVLWNNYMSEIEDYINRPNTATVITNLDDSSRSYKKQIVTSELIYYWMIRFNIPSEYEKWHLNRLMTLIQICNIKEAEKNPRKKSRSELARDYNRRLALNEKRRRELGLEE